MRRKREGRARAGRQRGYALLELALALLMASLLAAWGVQALVNRFNDAQAQSAAVWMDAVHKAVLAYVRQHGPAMQMATGSAALSDLGYQDWRAPTLVELANAGLLSTGLPQAVRLVGAAHVTVWRRGICPGDGCIIEALVHGDRPLRDKAGGRPDEAMMAQWLLAAQGQGAAVHPGDPARIRGAAFAFSSTLPDGTVLPAGTVGMAVTADHQALWSFLRVRDQRDPDFQGGLSVTGEMRGASDLTLAGQVVIGAYGADGMECATAGAVAHDPAGGLLVCRHGYWRSASRAGGGGYGYNDAHGCRTSDGFSTANPVTGDCSCPWYTSVIQILDTGPRAKEEGGRQYAYLCVG